MSVEKLIGRIKAELINQAVSGLRTPQSKDAFELGRLCGIQQGIATSLQIVEQEIGEDESNKTAGRKK